MNKKGIKFLRGYWSPQVVALKHINFQIFPQSKSIMPKLYGNCVCHMLNFFTLARQIDNPIDSDKSRKKYPAIW